MNLLPLAALLTLAAPLAAQDLGTIHVTKSPTCGCCAAWVDLARAEGYAVETTDTLALPEAKLDAGVPVPLWSCHTATIDGYVIEGHVPFDALARLLADRPAIDGLSVPGMPAGSPGMGDDPAAVYDVIAFGQEAGDGTLYHRAGQ